jgi:hypothetical protein
MNDWVVKGKAFWEFDGSGKKHLYFVISEPDIEDKVLVVNVTDDQNAPAKYDKSCVITRHEYPAITKNSVVFYWRAKELIASTVLVELQTGRIERSDDLSENLLNRIQAGAKTSDFLPDKAKKYFEYF